MVRELNLKFKLFIQQKGGIGIRSLKLIFRRMDFNGNGKLDSGEFEQALAAFGYAHFIIHFLTRVVTRLFPKKVELQALMKHYDMDGDGNITYEEFLRGLR